MRAFRSPRPGLFGRWQTRLANAPRLRGMLRHLPFVGMESDVGDILYCSWIVPMARLADRIPPGVRVVEREGQTILTVLTYAHGHFGPRLAGPLRRLFPSPLQSNWRLYVETIDGTVPPERTVLFLDNLFDSALYAIGTRLMSDALPSHLPERFTHAIAGDRVTTTIIGGNGSAPGMAVAARAGAPAAHLAPFFEDWPAMVAAMCLQDAAVAAFGEGRLATARIDLPIDPATVMPMVVEDYRPGDWLRGIGATAAPLCFYVPGVRFRVLSEAIIR